LICRIIIGLRKIAEGGVVELKTLKVKFQHLGEPDRSTFLGWNMNNGRYEDVDYDISSNIKGDIAWNNSCVLEVETEQKDVFASTSLDDFEKSPFEGQAMEVNW